MELIGEARKILASAEAELRRLIETALQANKYEAIAEIAALAKDVRSLRGEEPATTRKFSGPVSKKAPPNKRLNVARHSKNDYPQFELDGDRLVKVGWSKKNRQQYEHRAPQAAVQRVLEHISHNITSGRTFTMEEILSVSDTDGSEIPSYQVYLAIAWIRQHGVVNKKGRDGYVLEKDPLAEHGFDELWSTLPKREA